MKIALLSGGVPLFQSSSLIDSFKKAINKFGQPYIEPPQITQQLPTKQPHRKTGIAQSRRDARKRRNRK